MNETIEALITSDSSTSGGALFTCNVWDIHTGTILHSYKNGGVCSPNTLCQINNDYILAGENLKPLLHLWQMNSQEPVGKSTIRLVVPGNVNALDVSPNGMYCAAAIEEKLYIWQLATGRLLAVISKHFQPITKVLFTNDGSHLITTGNDSLVLIWSVAHLIIASQQHNDLLISQSVAGQTDPIHTISDHSMPVKDMCVGKSGTRLITVSTDRTMKLYDLIAGRLLLSVVFDVCLTAVLLNKSETHAFIGSATGEIFQVGFLNPPRDYKEYHHRTDNNELSAASSFLGHGKSVTCLAITIDSRILVSGSVDEQVIVWHVDTKQKLRVIPHKGTITNLRFIIARKNIFNQEYKPASVVQTFERNVQSNQDLETGDFINVIHNTDKQLPTKYASCMSDEQLNVNTARQLQRSDANLQDEINKLKAVNAKLYQFALDNILDKVEMNGANVVSPGKPNNKRKR